MTLFHIKYPASRSFLTWDELGCLCRSLGFPSDLFKKNFPSDNSEFRYDDQGIEVKVLFQLLDLGSMYRVLHRTYNMHTADWNKKVIRRAMDMLEHKVLDFDGVYNVRVAFTTYEHSDMKGMLVNKRLLLRTLKLCGRMISPMKLLHRIKHMRTQLEEKGRIQLYEFFNLILWCELYPVFNPEDVESASGKNDNLFRLVNIHRLLSHHDERVANRLDAQYLKDERNFGREALEPRCVAADPLVDTDYRTRQAEYHKAKYHQLQQEVKESEKRVHCAHAGSVRDRPISAPDLKKYRITKTDSSGSNSYKNIRKRIQSAPSRGFPRDSERPHLSEYKRTPTPRVVTPRDLSDVEAKMNELNFDISTLDCKIRLQLDAEMDFYIPGYKEKLPKQKQEVVPEAKKKPGLWTAKRIEDLTHPPVALPPTHAKTCDARFRGWGDVNSKPGYHVVLDTRTHEQSEKGKLLSKLERGTMTPVLHVHPGYIVRNNRRARSSHPRKPPYKPDVDTRVSDGHDEELSVDPRIHASDEISGKTCTGTSESKMTSGINGVQYNDTTSDDSPQLKDGQVNTSLTQRMPVPYMEHSSPKLVNVGQIGTITLLENIQEAAEFGDTFTATNPKFHDETQPKSDRNITFAADVQNLKAFGDTDVSVSRGQNQTSKLTHQKNCMSHLEKSSQGKLRSFRTSAPHRRKRSVPTSPWLLDQKIKAGERRSAHNRLKKPATQMVRDGAEHWTRPVNSDMAGMLGSSESSKIRTNKPGNINVPILETVDSNDLPKLNKRNRSVGQTSAVDPLKDDMFLWGRLEEGQGDDLFEVVTVNPVVQMAETPYLRNQNSEDSPGEMITSRQLRAKHFSSTPKDTEETKTRRQKARSRLIGRIQSQHCRLSCGRHNGLIYVV